MGEGNAPSSDDWEKVAGPDSSPATHGVLAVFGQQV